MTLDMLLRSILHKRKFLVNMNDALGYDAGAERSITMLHAHKVDCEIGEKGKCEWSTVCA
jgi:hypothetical protein